MLQAILAMPLLSANIIARNEAKNIARAIHSCAVADEVVVVDAESVDETREIASQLGARVIVQPWLGFARQKNAALEHSTHDWILSLDADEEFDQTSFINFLIVRGITVPSLRYDNKTSALDVYEGKLSEAIKHYGDLLQRTEDVRTGLLAGPEDCWQFSILIFICSQIVKNADQDIQRLLDEYHRNNKK